MARNPIAGPGVAGSGEGTSDGTTSVTGAYPDGATLVRSPLGFVLIERAGPRSLGGALAWARKSGVQHLHLLVDTDPQTAGALARRATYFSPEVTVWSVDGAALHPVAAAPFADTAPGRREDAPGDETGARAAGPAPDDAATLMALFEGLGLEVTIDAGIITGSVWGLEVARVVTVDGHAAVEVGVGRFDREVAQLLHDEPAPEAVARVAEIVRSHRHPGAPPHPLRDLVPELWMRRLVITHPEWVGADFLEPCDTPVERPNLRAVHPSAALGGGPEGPMVVVCGQATDLDLVAVAADTLARWAPGGELVVVAVGAAVPRSVTDLVHAYQGRARLLRADPPWVSDGAPPRPEYPSAP